jgi:hypothetical protein
MMMMMTMRLATLAAVTRLVLGQEPGSTSCPCASTTSWLAAATATSAGSQVLQSTVGSRTTDYPITYGLDGCQAYSATNSPSCVDLDTGVALVRSAPFHPSGAVPKMRGPPHPACFRSPADNLTGCSRCAAQTRRPAWCEDKWCYVDDDHCEIAGGAISSTLFPNAYLSYQTCASATGVSTNTYEQLVEVGSGVTELTSIVENYLYASAAEAERVAAATSTTGYQTCDASMSCPYAPASFSLSLSLSLSLCRARARSVAHSAVRPRADASAARTAMSGIAPVQ